MDFNTDHFSLFELPARFRLDAALLDRRYLEMQSRVHPDRFAAADAGSQRLSLQGATLVNEAFATLKDPLKRAQYLLALRGVEQDPQKSTLNDPAFLMQQMELREALAAVSSAQDPRARLDALLDEIGGMIKHQLARLAVQLEDGGADQLAAAAETIQKMQFLNKLHAQAEAIEADLEEAI